MVFSSQIFLFYFLPIFLLVYFILISLKVKLPFVNFWITLCSYVFYGWSEPWFVLLMFVSSLIDYQAGKYVYQCPAHSPWRKVALVSSITSNLLILGFFKYFVFTVENINRILELWGLSSSYFHVMQIVLPVGISFYTFQSMSYAIDIYRGQANPAENFMSFSCYVALFPQLVAGPIVRYNVVANELVKRIHTSKKFLQGLCVFSVGFAKKILIANPMGEIADKVWAAEAPGTLAAWWGNLAYMLQIYFDFSAYSEMAYGLGLMLAFRFVRNFNAPYLATSLTEFWQRWHMSLTQWFRDYLYIPLGGNRVSQLKVYRNLLIVMLLSGIWHGAQWTFILWGLFHAACMIGERLLGKKTIYAKAPIILQILFTQILVLLAWVLFRAPNLDEALRMYKEMLGLGAIQSNIVLLHAQIFNTFSLFIVFCAVLLIVQPIQGFFWALHLKRYKVILALFLFIYACFNLFTQSYNPFLYFQF